MDFTDRYIHVCVNEAQQPAPSFINNTYYQVTLSSDSDRVPYALVEVVSATIHAVNNNANTFVLKCDEIASNQINNLNTGSTFCLIDYNTMVTAGHHNYDIVGYSSKLMLSNARKINIYFTDEAGDVILADSGQILGFNIIFKVTYPVVGAVPQLYRTQIPL